MQVNITTDDHRVLYGEDEQRLIISDHPMLMDTGATAVRLLTHKLPDYYLRKLSSSMLRGLFSVIRSLPVHSVVEIEEVNATIAALMRKCLLNEQPRKWSSVKKPSGANPDNHRVTRGLASLGSLTRDLKGSDASLESHDASNSSDPSLAPHLTLNLSAGESTLLPLQADEAWIQATASSLMHVAVSTNSHTQVREVAINILQLLYETQARGHAPETAEGSAKSGSFSAFLQPLFSSISGTPILQRKLLPVRNLDYMISSAEVLIFYFKHYLPPPSAPAPAPAAQDTTAQQQGSDGSNTQSAPSPLADLNQMIIIIGEALALLEKEDASLVSRMMSYAGGGPTIAAVLKLRCKVCFLTYLIDLLVM